MTSAELIPAAVLKKQAVVPNRRSNPCKSGGIHRCAQQATSSAAPARRFLDRLRKVRQSPHNRRHGNGRDNPSARHGALSLAVRRVEIEGGRRRRRPIGPLVAHRWYIVAQFLFCRAPDRAGEPSGE